MTFHVCYCFQLSLGHPYPSHYFFCQPIAPEGHDEMRPALLEIRFGQPGLSAIGNHVDRGQ